MPERRCLRIALRGPWKLGAWSLGGAHGRGVPILIQVTNPRRTRSESGIDPVSSRTPRLDRLLLTA